MIVSLILSIEGCEYAFGDANAGGSYTYGSDDWSTAWTIVSGALDVTRAPAWSERARSDGTFEGGGQDFTLHDAPAPSGSVAGLPICTALFTKSPVLIPSTTLAASISATDGTLTVTDFTALGLSTPCTIWVEREAIRIASRVGNVLTVAAGGRGYLGTYGVPHVVDAEARYFPEVWSAMATRLRRRVILWGADEAGAVKPLWRGTIGKNRLHRDGARFTLQCESIYNLHANFPLGDEYATTRFRGFNVNAGVIGVRADSGAPIGIRFRPWDGIYGRPIIVSTLDEARQEWERRIRGWLNAAGLTGSNATVRIEGGGVVFRLDAAAGISNAEILLRVGSQQATGRTTEAAGTRRAEARVDGVPPLLVVSAVAFDGNILPITSVARMPTSWAQVAGLTTYAGARTAITPTLQGALDDSHVVDVYVRDLVATGTFSTTPGPLIVGTARIIPKDGSPPRITLERSDWNTHYIDTDVLLKVAARVVTDHWAAGLANAIGERTVLRSQVPARDWDFSTIPDVIAATFGPFARREWTFDGSFRLGDLLKEELCLNGCALSLRHSQLAIVPIGPATASSAVAATLGELDAHDLEVQDWEELDEEQITTVEADLDGTKLRVNDQRALGRYLAGRTVQVKARGRSQALRTMADPLSLANALLARVIGPYSDPVGLMTFPVVASEWVDRMFIGDYVDISEWLVPDGTGGRGVGNVAALAAAGELSSRAQVRGRDVDLERNLMRVELLLFPQVYGYAPAVKVASSPSTTTITCATAFINALGDYTNPDAGAADGGAARFRVGDRVRLVQMDTTSDVSEALIILSISGTTITFTTTISGGTRTSIAAGDWWDLVYDDYGTAGLQDAQKRFAYVGSIGAGVIGGTSDPNRPWAP